MELDPMEGSSHDLKHILKVEVEVEEDDEEEENDDEFKKALSDSKGLDISWKLRTLPPELVFSDTEVSTDPVTGLFICLLCLEDLQPDHVKEHMVNVHKYRKVLFKCWVCETVFQDRSDLAIHRKTCRPKKPQKRSVRQIILEADALNNNYCPICLIEVDNLRDHSDKEHSRPLAAVECNICHKAFKSKITLGQHTKLVHQSVQDSAKCSICGQKFASPKYLQNHVRNVHPSGDKIHKCEVCAKEFKSHQSVYQHIKNVHPETKSGKIHNCDICDRGYKSHQSLYHHKKNVHWKKKSTQIHTCDICCKEFGTHQSLYQHLRNVHKSSKRKRDTICCGHLSD